jgi:hypothetical protein
MNSNRQVWRDLYRGWLPQSDAIGASLAAFDWIMAGNKSNDWYAYLKDADLYGRFYDDAGLLKEELKQPAPPPATFDEVWNDAEWLARYETWLRDVRFAGENLDFLYDVERWRGAPSVEAARELIETNLARGINFYEDQRLAIEETLDKGETPDNLFWAAYLEVYNALRQYYEQFRAYWLNT